MGKRSKAQSPEKISKHEKKQPLNNLIIKILRPKVYITSSNNFKDLVQELTGNTNTSPVSSPPPSLSASHPTRQVLPFIQIEDHAYQELSLDLSFDSSCFSTPLEGSPDLQVRPHESFNYVLEDSELGSQKNMDTYSPEYGDLESFLMEMDSISSCDACCDYGMIQQEVFCVYDYDLSTLI